MSKPELQSNGQGEHIHLGFHGPRQYFSKIRHSFSTRSTMLRALKVTKGTSMATAQKAYFGYIHRKGIRNATIFGDIPLPAEPDSGGEDDTIPGQHMDVPPASKRHKQSKCNILPTYRDRRVLYICGESCRCRQDRNSA